MMFNMALRPALVLVNEAMPRVFGATAHKGAFWQHLVQRRICFDYLSVILFDA